MASAMVKRAVLAFGIIIVAASLPAASAGARDSLPLTVAEAAVGGDGVQPPSLDHALQLRDEGRLAESIRVFEELLHRDPTDTNLGRLYAETLAWDDRLDEARAQYAAMAARGDSTSLLGLAMTDSWAGDLSRGAVEYEALVENGNLRPRARLGLARVRFWQGRYAESTRLLDASGLRMTPEGRKLSREIEDETAVLAIVVARFESDNDGNHFSLGQLGPSAILWRDFRGEALFGGGTTTGRSIDYDLLRGEAGVDGPVGGIWRLGLRGGLERRDPRAGGSTPAERKTTDRGFGLSYLKADAGNWRLGLTAGTKHLSDNPALIASDIGLTSFDLDFSWIPRRWFQTDLGGAFGSFSDSNRRYSEYLAIHGHPIRMRPTLDLGIVHRRIQNEHGGPRAYFSPKRYFATEGFFSLEQNLLSRRLYYFLRFSLGAQRVDSENLESILGALMSVEVRPTRSLRISVSGGHTDSGAQSASGYKLDRATLRATFLF